MMSMDSSAASHAIAIDHRPPEPAGDTAGSQPGMMEREPCGTTEVQASRLCISALKNASTRTTRLPRSCGHAGALRAHSRISEKIDQAGDRGEHADDDADHRKARRKNPPT